MGLSRSTFYDMPATDVSDAAIVNCIITICDEFETYGYRRVGAALRHQGLVVNGKKVRRLMREHDLQPKRRRRYVATTDSDHDSPIFPGRARDVVLTGPNQLWVADITYIAIATGFVADGNQLGLFGRGSVRPEVLREETWAAPYRQRSPSSRQASADRSLCPRRVFSFVRSPHDPTSGRPSDPCRLAQGPRLPEARRKSS